MKDILKTYTGLSKSVYILCSATLINRLGDFVVPFLTLFLTVKLNMSVAMSGIIVTCASLISIPSSLIGGKISDTLGRKKVYVFGQSLSALFYIICGFCSNEYLIITLIFISTFFNGLVRPAYNALLIDFLPRNRRQAGMSLNYLCINIGVAIGPVVAGFLFNKFLPLIFIGDGITSLLGVAIVIKTIKEDYSKTVNDETNIVSTTEAKEEGNILKVFLNRPQLIMFFGLYFLYELSYSQNVFTLPLTVNNALNDIGPEIFGYMMSINAVTCVVLTVFITSALKNYHHLTNMFFSGIAFALGYGMLIFVNSISGFFISTFIWTLGEIMCSISLGVFVADNSPVNFRARISAIQNLIFWISSTISISCSGFLIDKIGLKFIWCATFVITLIASILMYFLKIYCVKHVDTQNNLCTSDISN